MRNGQYSIRVNGDLKRLPLTAAPNHEAVKTNAFHTGHSNCQANSTGSNRSRESSKHRASAFRSVHGNISRPSGASKSSSFSPTVSEIQGDGKEIQRTVAQMAEEAFDQSTNLEDHEQAIKDKHKAQRQSAKKSALDADFQERLNCIKTNDFTKTFPKFVYFFCSTQFESILGGIIIANCVLIGMEVQLCPPESSPRFKGDNANSDTCPATFLNVMEHFFTAFFLVEFILRVMVFGFAHYTRYLTNFCDGVLVWVTGVLPTWILSGDGNVRKFTALRAFRLFRVARVVRTNPTFKEMWLLLKGLGDSMRTLFWTIVVMVFVNYLFGIFAVIQIGDSDVFEETDEKTAQSFFEGLDMSLFTLLQIVTGDSWSSGIARPIMKHLPWLWIYFVAYVAIAMLVLLNLITAVIVDNAMAISKADEEHILRELHIKREEELQQLGVIFTQMDADGSGEINHEEFVDAITNRHDIIAKFHLAGFHDDNEIKNLFATLDDGDGSLTIEEFVDGLRSMQGEAKSKDIVKLTKALHRLHKDVDDLKVKLEEITGSDPARRKSRVTYHESRKSLLFGQSSSRRSERVGGGEGGGGSSVKFGPPFSSSSISGEGGTGSTKLGPPSVSSSRGGAGGEGGGGLSEAQIEGIIDRALAKHLENLKSDLAAMYIGRPEVGNLLNQARLKTTQALDSFEVSAGVGSPNVDTQTARVLLKPGSVEAQEFNVDTRIHEPTTFHGAHGPPPHGVHRSHLHELSSSGSPDVSPGVSPVTSAVTVLPVTGADAVPKSKASPKKKLLSKKLARPPPNL